MTTPADGSQKKGRPTPKRRDAQASTRISSLAPASTKIEKKRAKDAARVARMNQRAAYLRGDEAALPLRDRGAEKRFVRNYVDARRSIGEFFLPVIGLVLILLFISESIAVAEAFAVAGIAIMYSVLLVSIFDGFFLSRKIKTEVAKRFPDKSTKGLGLYGWLRSTQMRRLRAPKPQVKPGEKFN
jgi:hypothetical protein